MNDELAGLGHNLPVAITPPDLEDFKVQLEREHADLFSTHAALTARAEKVPAVIEDDDVQGRVAELVKMMRNCESDLNSRRLVESRPWSAVKALVDATFTNRSGAMNKTRAALTERTEAYTKRKAAREAARMEEEARQRRLAADAALKAAEEAEVKRKEAEWDRMLAEADQANAEWERDNADRLRLEAEERLRQAKAKEAQEAKERLARKERDEAAAKKAADERKKAEAEAEASKTKLAEARAKLTEAKADVKAAETSIRTASREERLHMADASREENRAERIELKLDDGTKLGTTRSEHGALATTRMRWTCRVTDYNRLDGRALWPYVSQEARDAALYAFMRAGGRHTPGAVIEEVEEGVVI
jgi:chromosome segregation ATPase